jgi:dihydroorotate dehydrogenase (fumarate)
MVELTTRYMGLTLSNPIIVASCSLTKSVDGVCACADAGAGAVVLKSLFEEQIRADVKELERNIWISGHPEAVDYVRNVGFALGPRQYLNLIEQAKQKVSVPIIASINCVSPGRWADYAEKIAQAGADALELNISVMPVEPERGSEEIERMHFRIVEDVVKRIKLPVAVKLGPYFTSMARMATELCERGVAALVLFNRFYQPDINVDKLHLVAGYRFSSPEEMNVSLRWIALLAGRVACDFAASTGVHDGIGIIKQLLAGANAVQVCSALYVNRVSYIETMLTQVQEWMKQHSFASLDQVRGKLSQSESDRPELYERMQYIKALVGIE